jgi:hypothetical protein
MFLVLSAKVKKNLSQNERLWQTQDMNNVFGPTFDFKIHNDLNVRNRTTKCFATLMIPIFLHVEKLRCLISCHKLES